MVDDETYLNMRNQWQLELDKCLVKYEKTNNASDDFIENIENLSNLCKSLPDKYLSHNQEEKRKLMNLVMSNPIFDGSKLVFTVYPAFEYAMKLNNLEMVGVYRIIRLVAKAWFCSTLRAGSLRDAAPYRKSSEPTDKTPSCVASLHTLPIKKTAEAVFFIGEDGDSAEQK